MHPTSEAFETEIEKFKYFPDSFMKVKSLDDGQSVFHAVPKIVFGRLSAHLAESFNSFMLHNGVRHCDPLNMVALWTSNLYKRSKIKLIEAQDRFQSGAHATKSAQAAINI